MATKSLVGSIHVLSIPIAITTSGGTDLVSAVTGKSIKVMSMFAMASAATNIYFASASSTGDTANMIGGSTAKMPPAANGGWVLPWNPAGYGKTALGEKLSLNQSSTSATIGGTLQYTLEDYATT